MIRAIKNKNRKSLRETMGMAFYEWLRSFVFRVKERYF